MISKNFMNISSLSLSILALCSCSAATRVLNPFYEEPGPIAYLGEPNDHALNGKAEKEDTARMALETMASYQRAHEPKPVNPVVQPSVVRLMWVPDHLNRNGDLVPAHYYYMRVLDDRFAVTDAFELEAQLGKSTDASAVPYIFADERKMK